MDALAALRLQLEWGVDEALFGEPVQRLRSPEHTAPVATIAVPPAIPGPAPPRASRPAAGLAGADAAAARALASAATDIGALRAAVRAFDPDGLAASATSLAFPAEAPAVGLAVLGDTPGADEDRTGAPFAGAPGALLDAMLASIGLRRRDAVLAHVLPWRPAGGRSASDAELAAYLPFLERLFALCGARRLLLLGTLPARALFGRDVPFARLRGRWRAVSIPDLGESTALVSYAPAQLLERPDLKPAAWRDLRLLRRTLDSG